MDTSILGSISITEGQIVPLIVLAISIITFAGASLLTLARQLRPIPAMTLLRSLMSQAIEARSGIHLGLGSGHIGGRSTAETATGLTLLEHLAQQSAVCDTPLTVSVADPITLAAAQGIVRRSMGQSERSDIRPPVEIHFIAPEPIAYASATAHLIERDKPALSILIGTYGPEYLVIGSAATRAGTAQVAGTPNLEALPLMYAAADETLVGEEVFGLGGYLGRSTHLGSLMAEDILRAVTAVLILAGVVVYSLRF